MTIDNFGTYQRMCGFGGGECRSVIRTLCEKRIEFTRLNKYEEKKENIKIYVTCVGQDLNLAPPCKQIKTLPIC